MESKTAVTGEGWIRHPTHPLVSQKLLSRVTRGFDSPDSPISSQKLLSRVTGGFDTPHTLSESETGVMVMRGFDRPDSPLGSQKLLSPVTRGFDSQTAPQGVRNCCHR